MFSINNVLRHAERRRAFSVDGLRRLATQSIDRSPNDIVDLTKTPRVGLTIYSSPSCASKMMPMAFTAGGSLLYKRLGEKFLNLNLGPLKFPLGIAPL